MKICEITYETPLNEAGENPRDVILNSSTVRLETANFKKNSELSKLIMQRIDLISFCLEKGILTDNLVVFGDDVCTNYCNKIIDKYRACLDSFSSLADNIKIKSNEREKEELVKLRNEVEKELSKNRQFISEKSADDKNDDPLYEKTIQDNTNLGIKLGDIDRRLSGLSFDFTDKSLKLIRDSNYILSNDNGEDNNAVYGADIPFDVEKVTNYIDDNDIQLRDNYIGYGGVLTNEKSNIYRIAEIDGKRVFVIYNGFEGRNKVEASAILYMYEDEDGHNICYDKMGNPISYNTAMNILDISRCSCGSNCGYTDNFYHPWENTPYLSNVKTEPTADSPSINSINAEGKYDVYENIEIDGGIEARPTGEKYIRISCNHQWEDSLADPDGNVWHKVCDKMSDSSYYEDPVFNKKFTPEAREFLNIGDSGCYALFTKDKGDMGTINAIVGKDYSTGEEYPYNYRYYSIKQPDGSYLYYDKYCTPVSESDWKPIVNILKNE